MLNSVRSKIGEMWGGTWSGWFDVSRSMWYSPSMSALRSLFSEGFFQRPRMSATTVNFDLARSLYRNDNPRYNLGSGFVRPIVDLTVQYMGVPSVSTDDPDTDDFLNECLREYWAPKLLEAYRDMMRDSKVVVMFRQPSIDNPLFTEEDRKHGKLDIIPPEMISITFSPSDPDLIERAVITHYVTFDERTEEEAFQGFAPRKKEHEIIEVITPQDFKWWDKTANIELTTWGTPNYSNFVPVWPQWNEYASDLGGGQSDLEPVLPFIEAFHQVLSQALDAHAYHSTPKATFKVNDVNQFIANNFPEAIDPATNQITNGAKIKWSGNEIIFLQPTEDAGFIEAQSVLGDSKTLLEFLTDCIAVASETPKWALLKTDTTGLHTASVQPFEKKIVRKRIMVSELIVMLCKMVLVVNKLTPDTPRVAWPPVRLEDLMNKAQALQQIIMGLDVAHTNQWIAGPTVVKILSSFFDEIGSPEEEMAAAKNNFVPPPPPVAPIVPPSPTQAIGPGSSNGSGSKAAAQKAIQATTAASKS